jgi:hypothetical protein
MSVDYNKAKNIGDNLFDILKFAGGASCFSVGVWHGVLIPDFDITDLGIGFHRHFLYHSATPAAIASFLRRRVFEKIKSFNERKGYLSPKKIELIEKAAALYVAGMAIGQAGHFIADATWQGSKAIVWRIPGIFDLKSLTGSNSLVPGTLLDDHLWLWGNTVVALKIAWEELKFALGKEHPMIKAMMWIGKWIGKQLDKLWRKVKSIKSKIKEIDNYFSGKTASEELMTAISEAEPDDPSLDKALSILEGRV